MVQPLKAFVPICVKFGLLFIQITDDKFTQLANADSPINSILGGIIIVSIVLFPLNALSFTILTVVSNVTDIVLLKFLSTPNCVYTSYSLSIPSLCVVVKIQ